MNINRLKQIMKYGWLHAGQVSNEYFGRKKRINIFIDIIGAYFRYNMWSNQYVGEKFWELSRPERESVGAKWKAANRKREAWVKEFYENRKFLSKWSRYEIEKSPDKRNKRNIAYANRYGMGGQCLVEHGVEISRQHYLDGTIKIGNHVLLAKHVFIDYSGEVIIDDNVKITAGVSIQSHHHDLDRIKEGGKKDIDIPTKLHICEGAFIGTHAIILDSCNYIGKHSRIGAGAVVTKDIPDYSVAVGVPAKVVKMLTPGEA